MTPHEWTLDALPRYWSSLISAVHPDDAFLLARETSHGFNLDFPPHAFVGDIVNAPVVILDYNGGYSRDRTPDEFPDAQAQIEFRQRLGTSRPVDPKARGASPYYLSRNFSDWLIDGRAALLNAVAYRSVDGNAADVRRLTKMLPSECFHREWLKAVLTPSALRGERFVVVHRWTLWGDTADGLRATPASVFSSAPVSRNLTALEMTAARSFLAKR